MGERKTYYESRYIFNIYNKKHYKLETDSAFPPLTLRNNIKTNAADGRLHNQCLTVLWTRRRMAPDTPEKSGRATDNCRLISCSINYCKTINYNGVYYLKWLDLNERSTTGRQTEGTVTSYRFSSS